MVCEKAFKLAHIREMKREIAWQTVTDRSIISAQAQWKAWGKYNSYSCCCCWVVLFTCWTIFIPFIILLVLSKFPLTWKIVHIDGFPPAGKSVYWNLENAARGRKPRAANSRPRLTLFFISFFCGKLACKGVCLRHCVCESVYVPSTNDSLKKYSQRLI